MKRLSDYPTLTGPTQPLRIFKSDKARFGLLQARLAVATDGQSWSQAQVLAWLLDMAEGLERFQKQEPPS